MRLNEAIELIKNNFISGEDRQVWADLGCGTGTFTLALASLLPENSSIYAIDKSKIALNKIPIQFENIIIKKIEADFIKIELPDDLDGILMANSLHYIREKHLFIRKIMTHIKQEGCFLIVEYDTEVANPWIPFPVSFDSLKKLFKKEGYKPEKLKDKPSLYRKEKIYSALIKR